MNEVLLRTEVEVDQVRSSDGVLSVVSNAYYVC